MGGVRNGKDAGSPEVADPRQRPAEDGAGASEAVERHRRSAARLLKEGQAARAFGELVRASRSLPMTPRLASTLVAFSLRAGTEASVIALLSSALGNARGESRRSLRLQLARVLRRVDQLPRAIESIQALVDEAPGDHRARRLLDVLSRPKGARPVAAAEDELLAAPIVQGRHLTGEMPLVRPVTPDTSEEPNRSETVEFSSPWVEDENTAEALVPPDARFSPRAPQPRPAPVTPPPAEDPERHRTVLEMPAPWTPDEEVTSEVSGLPFALVQSPVFVAPRDDVAGDASSHRRESLDVTRFLLEEEETATEVPPSLLGSPPPVASPPPVVASSPVAPPRPAAPPSPAPVPWGAADDDAEPSRLRVARRDSPEHTRIEAQLIARRAWRELAQFYLSRADESKDLSVRAEALTRLAELLEDELQDRTEAARVYGQIVALTGDQTALTEQVRLLSLRADGGEFEVRRVLDEAVQRANTPRNRVAAFLARGERLLSTGERARARGDFDAVLALTPHSLPALMGLARSVPEADRAQAAERLRAVLAPLPRRAPGRIEGLRCLAELAGGPLADARLAHWACSEVLAEDPGDVQAQDQLLSLTRQLGDKAGLSRLLRARLGREPRGPVARKARIELVTTLESAGERDAALAELRQAVRFEPGHKEAWVLLVERLIALGQKGEAAWAMEHAATATEDDTERLGTWERLARFCREVLGDAARAQVYSTRADNLREAIAERAMPVPPPEPPRPAAEPPRPPLPRSEQTGVRTAVLIPPPTPVAPTPAKAVPVPTPVAPPARPVPAPPPAVLIPTPAAVQAAPDSPATVLEMPAVSAPPPPPPLKPQAPVAKEAPAPPPLKPQAPVAKEAPAPSPPKPQAPAAKVALPTISPQLPIEPPAAPVEVESTRVIAWEAPPGKMDATRRRARPASEPPTPPPPSISPVGPGAPVTPVAAVVPPAKPAAASAPAPAPGGASAPAPAPMQAPAPAAPAPAEGRPPAIERVRERPLDAEAYRELSAFFLSRGDMARGSLMAEVASALTGEREPAPRAPRRTLSPEERAGLRHPGLRNPAGELLASVGYALCRLFPTFGRAAGSSEPLRPDSGPGARSALEVLQSVARLLDAELPEVFISEEDGPPFSLIHPGAPRLLVGRLAVRQSLPEPELRFFAGRALSCLGPDLLALRCLKKDQMLRAVAILASVLRGGTEFNPEARVVREALHPKARDRALGLLEAAQRDFDSTGLAEAARHSANRAGLVACGGPGPAVAALRVLKVSDPELIELVRFSASERYLPLRG